jgi:TRAP-type C4-dicarboxylate transport system permease small subunit
MEPEKDANVRRPASPLEKILEKVSSFCFIAAGMMVVVMAIVTTYGAARRYLFHSPDNNAYLISCILMLGCVAFSVAHIQTLKKHITVDYVSQHLPARIREVLLNIVGPILGLVFCVPFVWKSWGNAWFAMQSGERTLTLFQIPTFPLQFSIPFGAGLLSLVLLAQLVRNIISLRNHAS